MHLASCILHLFNFSCEFYIINLNHWNNHVWLMQLNKVSWGWDFGAMRWDHVSFIHQEKMSSCEGLFDTPTITDGNWREIKKEKDFLRVSIGSFLSGFWPFFTHNNYDHIPMILWFPFMICLPLFGGFIWFSNSKPFIPVSWKRNIPAESFTF